MKYFITVLLITSSTLCSAEKKCNITPKNLNFATPQTENIANTYWHDDKEDGEVIKRLFVTYRDGSTAIIKHTFCSEYKFEAVYYMEEQEQTNSTDKIKTLLTTFLSYVAHKDNMQKKPSKQ